MSTEVAIAEQWLFSRLHNDSVLASLVTGVYPTGEVPTTVAAPYVTFGLQQARDRTLLRERVWSVLDFQVVAWSESGQVPSAQLDQIAARIDALLHDQTGTLGNGEIVYSYRTEPVALVEEDDGRIWWRFGGLYRLFVRRSP